MHSIPSIPMHVIILPNLRPITSFILSINKPFPKAILQTGIPKKGLIFLCHTQFSQGWRFILRSVGPMCFAALTIGNGKIPLTVKETGLIL